jgi:serine/threonine-protein kinase
MKGIQIDLIGQNDLLRRCGDLRSRLRTEPHEHRCHIIGHHPAPMASHSGRTPTAQSAAEAIRAAIPEVTSLIAITEDNDANNMIGRMNGYVAATVLVDSRITEGCEIGKPGIACGAGIEQWPDEAAAQRRADYIKAILSTAPVFGTEYETVKGNLLLRVNGKLKPSAAQAYQVAFTG